MPNNPLAGGKVDVGGDEAAEFGVVISALEIVPAGFFVRQSLDWWCDNSPRSGRAAPRRRSRRESRSLKAACPKYRRYTLLPLRLFYQ